MQFSIAVFKHIVCNDASHQFQLSSLEFEAEWMQKQMCWSWSEQE